VTGCPPLLPSGKITGVRAFSAQDRERASLLAKRLGVALELAG
jgi:hypothetical protein